MPSYFIDLDANSLVIDTSITLQDSEHHHLAFVRRHRVGDEVLLNNGQGLLVKARLVSISKHESMLVVVEQLRSPDLPRFAIAFSLLKGQRDEYLLEKCTELGSAAFYPFISRFSIKREGKATLKRLERVTMAAIKQCDNPYLPKLHNVLSLEQCLKQIRNDDYTPILCSERIPEKSISSLDVKQVKPCFVIGPEGGWSQEELLMFEREGIEEYSISKLILRAETAAIAAAAQWVGKSSFS